MFFEKAFQYIGGQYTEERPAIFRIDVLPDAMVNILRNDYNLYVDTVRSILFSFDKQVFLAHQNIWGYSKIHYINPGNPVFDSLVKVIRHSFREEMLKGTILVSPDDKEPFLAFYVKSQITDNRPSKLDDSIADEQLVLVQQKSETGFETTSPARLIDLHQAAAADPGDTAGAQGP